MIDSERDPKSIIVAVGGVGFDKQLRMVSHSNGKTKILLQKIQVFFSMGRSGSSPNRTHPQPEPITIARMRDTCLRRQIHLLSMSTLTE